MSIKTSNYGAARGVLGFAEIILWGGVAVGIILALAAAGAVSNSFGRPGAGFAAAMPGVAISVVSFVGVVLIQMAKATVDTADYSYQMLAVARDQLEVSKQTLKHSEKAASYASRATDEASKIRAVTPSATAPEPKATDAKATTEKTLPSYAQRDQELPHTPKLVEHHGEQIERTVHGFRTMNHTFQTLELAQRFVDSRQLYTTREAEHGPQR